MRLLLRATNAGLALSAVSCVVAAPARETRAASPAGVVEVYVTTGDRQKLLHREADALSSTGTLSGPGIEVDPTRQYQEMIGFGAALTDASAWLIQHQLTGVQRDALLRELFGPGPGLGFSFVRIDMGASDFALRQYSYDDMPAGASDPALERFSIDADRAETIPILRTALSINPQLKVMASPWSAPAWMKSTGSMIKGTLLPDAYGPYAEYFRKFIQAYASAGVPIYAITIQNEPHYEPDNYPGMRVEPPARAKFIGQYLGPLLAKSGIQTRILDWDHNWDQPASPLEVLADSIARRYVSGIAWHCYAGEVSAQGAVHDAYPDKDAYFTECSGGDWAPHFDENLLWTTRNLIVAATRNWARGVLMWNLALDDQHGPHTGGCGNCRGVVTIHADGSVTRNEEYYALGHASRFVRPGSRRIASTDGIAGVESVAFRNSDDGSIALIVVNTTAKPSDIVVRSVERAFRYTVPAHAVATFHWK